MKKNKEEPFNYAEYNMQLLKALAEEINSLNSIISGVRRRFPDEEPEKEAAQQLAQAAHLLHSGTIRKQLGSSDAEQEAEDTPPASLFNRIFRQKKD